MRSAQVLRKASGLAVLASSPSHTASLRSSAFVSSRSAISEAIVEYQLDVSASDREVLEYTQSLIDALAAADAADDSGDLSLLPQTDDESVDPTVDETAG